MDRERETRLASQVGPPDKGATRNRVYGAPTELFLQRVDDGDKSKGKLELVKLSFKMVDGKWVVELPPDVRLDHPSASQSFAGREKDKGE